MSEVLAEYDRTVALYAAFVQKVESLMRDLLGDSKIGVHSITSRLKQRTSLAGKITKVTGRYESVSDITDVVGVRIICYFDDDVDRIAKIVEAEFDVDRAKSVDKRILLDPDRFGYLSLHYVVTLRADRVALAEYKRYEGLKAEVQIRSLLQHAWAEIEHDLGYKTARAIPRPIRREFSRLAGLLEIADTEFRNIRIALAAYERQLPNSIENSPKSVAIDKTSLRAFLVASDMLRAIDAQLAILAGGGVIPISDEALEPKVAALDHLGFSSVGDLEESLSKNESAILQFAQRWIQKSSRGVREGTSLMYLGYVMTARTTDLDRVVKFLSAASIGSFTERQDLARSVVETYRIIASSDSAET
jgi:putative GTP pyrophosphokinase